MNGPLKVGDMVIILHARTPSVIGCCGTVVGIHQPGHMFRMARTLTRVITKVVTYDVEIPRNEFKVNAQRSWLMKVTPPPINVNTETKEELPA